MKTTIDIPEKDLKEVMKNTGAKTKREAIVTAVQKFNKRKRLEVLAERLRLAPVPGDERECQGNAARCAVELAILDAYGRHFREPLSNTVLGGPQRKGLAIVVGGPVQVEHVFVDPAAPDEGLVVVRLLLQPKVQERERLGKTITSHELPTQGLEDQEPIRMLLLNTAAQEVLRFRELATLGQYQHPLQLGVAQARIGASASLMSSIECIKSP